MSTADPNFVVRAMRIEEVELLRSWAAAEEWNPGLHTGPCFFATDPGASSSANSPAGRCPASRVRPTTPRSTSSACTSSDRCSGGGATGCNPGGRGWPTSARGTSGWTPSGRSRATTSGRGLPSPTTTSAIGEKGASRPCRRGQSPWPFSLARGVACRNSRSLPVRNPCHTEVVRRSAGRLGRADAGCHHFGLSVVSTVWTVRAAR